MPELLKGREKGEILGRVHRKLPHLFSAKRFLHQAGGPGSAGAPGPATEARLQRVVQGLHDRHADRYYQVPVLLVAVINGSEIKNTFLIIFFLTFFSNNIP